MCMWVRVCMGGDRTNEYGAIVAQDLHFFSVMGNTTICCEAEENDDITVVNPEADKGVKIRSLPSAAGNELDANDFDTITLEATHPDFGVHLSKHDKGALVDEVPADSHGAAIGLEARDIIVKINEYSTHHYNYTSDVDDLLEHGVDRCIKIVENKAPVSKEYPVTLTVKRPLVFPRRLSKLRSLTATAEATRAETLTLWAGASDFGVTRAAVMTPGWW